MDTIVVKVKYGETLRRFNAVVVDKEIALDLNELREKVVTLFNFPSDSELTLTYIDEDGDVVTLADDEDLRDIMRQSLNPLRISVTLNTDRSGRSYGRSSGSSTPMRSPRVQPPLQNLNGGVSEILKSVPEAVRETLSRLSNELGSTNGASSQPVYPELLESLSKMALTYMKEVALSGTKNGSSGSSTERPVTEDRNRTKADDRTPVNEADQGNLPGLSNGSVSRASDLVDLNAVPYGEQISAGSFTSHAPTSYDVLGLRKKVSVNKLGENGVQENLNSNVPQGTMATTGTQSNDKKKEVEVKKLTAADTGHSNQQEYLSGPVPLTSGQGGLRGPKGGLRGPKVTSSGSGNSVDSRLGLNSFLECPFSGVAIGNNSSSVPGRPYAPRVMPFKRSSNHGDGIKTIFHRGVRCDGCGVHPITGPRYKSKVKEDYDLCSVCFLNMGNDAEYFRMDYPMSYRHPAALKSFNYPHFIGCPPPFPQVVKGSASGSKLDSIFIQDVSILDGTLMAPLTPFTKIWRLKNNGNTVWPRGTQLLWIGGDRFSETLSVELELPADGCPVDKEIDVAVEFKAPEHQGRFISYWRMASPSGQKFGQRVWVLIQVDDSLKDSSSENGHGFNLNLPPFSVAAIDSQFENASVATIAKENIPKLDNSNNVTELVEPVVDVPPTKDQELNFPINDTLLVGGALSNSSLVEASSAVAYPTVDFPAVGPGATNTVNSSTEAVAGSNDSVEAALLKELEEMGFKQVDLNKEILRMNEYNLEQSVDDLCGVSEWDPILEELQEMGFADKEMNKMLLKKNNGSIKRVVMDLIAGEKA